MTAKSGKNKVDVSINIGGNVKNSQIIGAGGDVNIGNQQLTIDYKRVKSAFEEIYKDIESQSVDSGIDTNEIQSKVKLIEQEVLNGENANESKVERWLKFLAEMAPDIFDTVTATLCSPILGISEVIKKIALRVRGSYS
jgi:hypothetical protein